MVTGHTGFIGSWLTKWLDTMDADICGCSLGPPSTPNMYELLHMDENIRDVRLDVRDYELLYRAVKDFAPEIIFHLAAQPLVLKSYEDPIATIETNVVGTANLLECVRKVGNTKVIVVMTSDKVYQNKEWVYPYRETDPLGGRDPYSASKSCADIIVNSYRESFFKDSGVGVSTIRAGNVIGGGDWGAYRLIPDLVRAISSNVPLKLRNPDAVRPWQYVLEPISGMMNLAHKMWTNPLKFSSDWNFGPIDGCKSVIELVYLAMREFGNHPIQMQEVQNHSEARTLLLDINKTKSVIGWSPILNLEKSIKLTAQWYKSYFSNGNLTKITEEQIMEYLKERDRSEKVYSGE